MDEEHARELGQRLRERREQLGLSTRDVAARAEMSHSTVVRLEQGFYGAPPADKLSSVAEALGLGLADVFALADYSVPSELPSFRPYLRTKYRDLPSPAVEELEKSFLRIAKRHGIALSGPNAGEDEQPEQQPTRGKKGGDHGSTKSNTQRHRGR